MNVQIGALILKEYTGMSDDEIFEALLFDVRFRYALHTCTFNEQPMSDRTLGRFRRRCLEYEMQTGRDIIGESIRSLSSELAKLMNVDTALKRMDSMMIASNIKKLGRLELIYTVEADLVKEADGYDLPDDLLHFLSIGDRNLFIYHTRSDSTEDKMASLLKEAKILKDFCIKEHYPETDKYRTFIRILKEQMIEEEYGFRLRTKEDGGMDSTILQNPSDYEATFRRKAGRKHIGYVANFI